MKKKKPSAIEAFLALPDAEKERQCAEFDKEFIGDSFTPLPPGRRALWNRIKRRGRPRVGRGAKVISLSVEKGLLAKADAAAKNIGISRAELFARGLRAVLSARR